jgi:hypothetical protein
MAGKGLYNYNDMVFRADHDQRSGDDFGLPDTGASSSGGASSSKTTPSKGSQFEPEEGGSGLRVFLIILFLCIVGFLVYWFVFRKPHGKEKVAAQDTTAVQVPKDTVTHVEPVPADTVPAQPAAGEISTINERTGRYYVVISSSIDSDLANDYATKLSKQGTSCTILGPPADKKGFYKLTVANFETFNEANSKAVELKGTYGDDIWVLKF